MKTVVIADDHIVVRTGLTALIKSEPGLILMGDASDAESTIRLVAEMKPDLLVLDISMPGMNGIAALASVREASPATRVLILSMHTAYGYVDSARQNGASGFVSKGAPAAELVGAIRAVAAGRQHFPSRIPNRRTTASDSPPALTERELDVLRLAARGMTSRQIAEHLGISPRTAEVHRANLMRKLGLRGTAELVLYATRAGLVTLTDTET